MGCCGRATWKREEVPDHKFDFIDVRDYYSNGFFTRLRYVWLYALVAKGFAVYIADIYTAITLLAFHHFNGNIYQRVSDNPSTKLRVPFDYGKWIFTGCIIFSFCLLAYEAHKARAVVRSRDISYAYTNVMANNYYSMKSYPHFCFFCQINNSKKKKDEFAFFIFFTFKGWKRLLVADGPRQVINAFTLYAFAEQAGFSSDLYKYYEGNYFTLMMLLTMIFTVVVFAGSAVLLILACLMYLPLVCYIQGNLKEYCCHKIDKRISELVQRKKKQRLGKYAAIARAEAAGDFTHLMNKDGIIVGRKMAQPTLPNLDIDVLSEDPKGALKAGMPLQRTASMSSSTVNGMQNDKPFYGMQDGGYGEEYGSTAQLVTNQGYAGSVNGHAVPGTNLSMSSATLNNHSQSNTAHNSPDALPVRVRGITDVQRANTPGLQNVLANMGPIGTSPQPHADQTAETGSRGHDVYSAHGHNGSGYFSSQKAAAGSYGKSPLGYAAEPVDAGNGYGGGQSVHQDNGDHEVYEMQQQQPAGYDQMYGQAHDVQGYRYSNDNRARSRNGNMHSTDLSAYVPYQEEDAYNDQRQQQQHYGRQQQHHLDAHGGTGSARASRIQSFAFDDVYDAYLQEPVAYGSHQQGGYERDSYGHQSVYSGEQDHHHQSYANNGGGGGGDYYASQDQHRNQGGTAYNHQGYYGNR